MFYERVIEIIVILLGELRTNKEIGEADVRKLTKLGYSQKEINTAFGWIYSKFHKNDKIFSGAAPDKRSHRVLHDVEKNVISAEAFGYLIQLSELHLLSDMDIEEILDKIMSSGFLKITLDDMKVFIAGYLLDTDEMNDSNKRIMLNSNDTIN